MLTLETQCTFVPHAVEGQLAELALQVTLQPFSVRDAGPSGDQLGVVPPRITRRSPEPWTRQRPIEELQSRLEAALGSSRGVER